MITDSIAAPASAEELRVMVRRPLLLQAGSIAKSEGLSLTEFVIAAIEDKISGIENQHWAENRKPLNHVEREEAIMILVRGGSGDPVPGDEIPLGYREEENDYGRERLARVAAAAREANERPLAGEIR